MDGLYIAVNASDAANAGAGAGGEASSYGVRYDMAACSSVYVKEVKTHTEQTHAGVVHHLVISVGVDRTDRDDDAAAALDNKAVTYWCIIRNG